MNELSLAIFCVSTCGSPGPNNFMIMSSGVTYGFRRSIPHVVGINIGFPIMVVAVGLGLAGIIDRSPVLLDVLRPIGVVYLLYLAYRIATAPVDVDAVATGRPLSALQAALFQWVNPKAWVMAVGAVVTYVSASSGYAPQVLLIAFVFLVLGTPCTAAWLCMGVSLKRVLRKPTQYRVFNIAMALLLVASIIPVIGEIHHTLTD